jgi:hypothetical protein
MLPAWLIKFFENSIRDDHTVSEYLFEGKTHYFIRFSYNDSYICGDEFPTLYDDTGAVAMPKMQRTQVEAFVQKETLVRTIESTVTHVIALHDEEGNELYRGTVHENGLE